MQLYLVLLIKLLFYIDLIASSGDIFEALIAGIKLDNNIVIADIKIATNIDIGETASTKLILSK